MNKTLFVIFIVCIAAYLYYRCQTSTVETYDSGEITMYGRDTCGFTVKMKNELKKSGLIKIIRYVDVTTPEGETEFKSKGFDGVPAFEGNGRVAMGYMKSTDLLKKLNM